MSAVMTVRELTADEAGRAVAPLAKILVDCVDGGASVSFMAPLTPERAAAY